MATPTYQAIAFITDDSDFSVAAAAERWRSLRGARNLHVTVASDMEALASFDGWELRLMAGEDDFVAREAKSAAAEKPDYPNAAAVAGCRRMASITSYDPDPNGDHFNDYLLAVEVIAFDFHGVYAMDTASGDWFDEGREAPKE